MRIGIEAEINAPVPLVYDFIRSSIHLDIVDDAESIPGVQISQFRSWLKQPDGTLVKGTTHTLLADMYHRELGDVLLKAESNSAGMYESPGDLLNSNISELVFRPVDINHADEIQNILTVLGKRFPTPESAPLSLQINVECLDLTPNQLGELVWQARKTRDVSMLPDSRRKFLTDFHPVVLRALRRPNISWSELFDVYFVTQMQHRLGLSYYQVLDLYANPELHTEEQRDVLAQVIKYSFLKISSLLMHHMPLHPITQYIESYQWVWTIPAVEFRDFQNDWHLLSKLDYVKGLMCHAQSYGK